MRLIFFITTIAFLNSYSLFAQPFASPQLVLKAPVNHFYKKTATSFLPEDIQKDTLKPLPLPSYLPLNFYSTHLGVACKMELQLEKQTKLPIRIRLGSKEQVDYLEGKFSRNQ